VRVSTSCQKIIQEFVIAKVGAHCGGTPSRLSPSSARFMLCVALASRHCDWRPPRVPLPALLRAVRDNVRTKRSKKLHFILNLKTA
jgi:hypothetical protein